MDVLGPRERKRRENHFSIDMRLRKLLEERGKVKRKDPTSAAYKSEYSRRIKQVKKQCKIDDSKWAGKVADKLEVAASRGQQREVWQKIKIFPRGVPIPARRSRIYLVNLLQGTTKASSKKNQVQRCFRFSWNVALR